MHSSSVDVFVMVAACIVLGGLALLWELANRGRIGRRATRRGLRVVAAVAFLAWCAWCVAGLPTR